MMISNADIIMSFIKNAGYKNIRNFVKINCLKERNINYMFENNCFTKPTLDKFGEILKIDLSMYVNAKLGTKRDFINDDVE